MRALWGVGPATAAKLQKLGLRYVRDLAKVDEATLAGHVGPAMASSLSRLRHGRGQPRSDRRSEVLSRSATTRRSLVARGRHEVSRRSRATRQSWRARCDTESASRGPSRSTVRFDDLTSVSRLARPSRSARRRRGIVAIAEALLSRSNPQLRSSVGDLHARRSSSATTTRPAHVLPRPHLENARVPRRSRSSNDR